MNDFWFYNICTKEVKENKYFEVIKYFILEAVDKYPFLTLIITKVEIGLIEHKLADASVIPEWIKQNSLEKISYTIKFNTRFLSKNNLENVDIGGLIWHEMGHIISTICYLKNNNFCMIDNEIYRNYKAKILSYLCGGETCYRLKLTKKFWKEVKRKIPKNDMRLLKSFIGQNLTANNKNELLAECFKYSYVGRKRYPYDLQIHYILNISDIIINEFELMYLCNIK